MNPHSYRQLTNPLLSDRRYLIGLSPEDLLVLANCKISPAEQSRLDGLLAKQAEEGELMGEDAIEVDRILAEVDSLMVLKARAMYTLKRLEVISLTTIAHLRCKGAIPPYAKPPIFNKDLTIFSKNTKATTPAQSLP